MKKICFVIVIVLSFMLTSCNEDRTVRVYFEFNDGVNIYSSEINEYGDIHMPEDPKQKGYIFSGWFYDNITFSKQFQKELLLNQTFLKNTTLFAKWDPILYHINYELDSGMNGTNRKDYTIETLAFKLEDPIKEHHSFLGWFDNELFLGESVQEINTDSAQDLNLYAKWEVNTYTVEFFDYNEHLISTQIIKYKSDAIPPNPPFREGYDFIKWEGNYIDVKSNEQVYPVYKLDKTDLTSRFKDPNLLEEIYSILAKEAGQPLIMKDLLSITRLEIDRKIVDLEGIELLSNLEILSLRNAPISNGIHLEGLTKLKHLVLEETELTDIEFVKNLLEITFFGIQKSKITDLSPITHLQNLEILLFTRSPLKELSHLSGLKKLNSLVLNETEVSDLSPLFNIKSLRRLNVPYTKVVNIDGISSLKELTDLELSGNKIVSFEELKSLVQLKTLFLNNSGFNVNDIDYLESLKELKTLDLDDDTIDELKSLVQFPSSSILYLWGFETNPTIDFRYAAFEAKLNKIKTIINESNSDLEKVLRVHDYLNAIGEIDESAQVSVIDLLNNGRGMCSTYTNATLLLLSMVGIDAYAVGGQGHAWNMVLIDEYYYHMDGFWNEAHGYAYFLISDDKINDFRSGPMFDWKNPDFSYRNNQLSAENKKFELLSYFLNNYQGDSKNIYLLDTSVIYFDPLTNEIKKSNYTFDKTISLKSNVESLLSIKNGVISYISTKNHYVHTMSIDGNSIDVLKDLIVVKTSSAIQNEIKSSIDAPYVLTLNVHLGSIDTSKIYYQDHLGNIVNVEATYEANVLLISPLEPLKSQRSYELKLLTGALMNQDNTATNEDIYRYFFTEIVKNPYHLTIRDAVDGDSLNVYVDAYNDPVILIDSDQALEMNYDCSRKISIHDEDGAFVADSLSLSYAYIMNEFNIELRPFNSLLKTGNKYTITIPNDYLKSQIDGSYLEEDFTIVIHVIDEIE